MKKEFYQARIDNASAKLALQQLTPVSLRYYLDGIMACAKYDEEISFEDVDDIMEHWQTIIDYSKGLNWKLDIPTYKNF